MQAQNVKQPKLQDLPCDTVSQIVWDPYTNASCFLTSSWDGILRYYSIAPNMEVLNLWSNFLGNPLTACEIAPPNVAIAGMTSGGIVACELGTPNVIPLAFHETPICALFWCKQRSFLISLGFDRLMRLWDLNQPLHLQIQIELPLKTFTACYDFPFLIIGAVDGQLCIVNVATLSASTTINADSYIDMGIDKASKLLSSSVNAAARRLLLGTADGKAHQFDIKTKDNSYYLQKIAYIRVGKRSYPNKRVRFVQINSVDVGCFDGKPFLGIATTLDATFVNPFTKYKILVVASEEKDGASTAIKVSPNLDFVVVCTGSDWTKGLGELNTLRRPRVHVCKLSMQILKKAVSTLAQK